MLKTLLKGLFVGKWITTAPFQRQTNKRKVTANAKLVGVVFTAAQRGLGTGGPQRVKVRKHIPLTEAFNGQNQPAESHSHHGPLCCRNKVSKHNTSLLSPRAPRGEFSPERQARASKEGPAREVRPRQK